MRHLADTSVLILGLGHSGLAMARWCARFGARVAAWDSRLGTDAALPDAQRLGQELPQLRLIDGAPDVAMLHGVRLLLKSPGLSPLDPRIAPLLAQARATGIPVHGELQLMMQALSELAQERGYAPAMVAITGTNGKTTTTAMTALLIEAAGRRVAVAGNIGPTMLDTLSQHLDKSGDEALPDAWVLELSSFQLDGVTGFEPSAAAVLNLSEDHLDWHGSLDAYADAKARIYGAPDAATVMVVNRDDPRVEAMVPQPTAVKGRAPRPVARRVIRFGLDAPRQAGDYGIVTENGMAWLVRALPADDVLRSTRRAASQPSDELHIQRMMPADALRVRGRHNAANALAALALADAIGCPLAPMLHALRDYAGEPHRLQHVATIGGVDAYDDSKGTNVGATVAAIDGLGADRDPGKLVLILGGDGKGQDFSPLVASLRRHARAVATLGRDAAAIEAALAALAQPDGGIVVQRHETLEAATRWCFDQARSGDAVLLSPACASLDMFRNYGHRGEVFVQAVHGLASDLGEVNA